MQKDINTAANYIAKPSRKNEGSRELVLVTGCRGSGNTAWYLELLILTRATRLRLVGLVSPAVLQTGIKTSINLMIHSISDPNQSAVKWDSFEDTPHPGSSYMNWRFDPTLIAWVNKSLLALEYSKFYIMDDLGLLESLHAKGLNTTSRILDEHYYYPDFATNRPAGGTTLEPWPRAKVLENPKAGEIRS